MPQGELPEPAVLVASSIGAAVVVVGGLALLLRWKGADMREAERRKYLDRLTHLRAGIDRLPKNMPLDFDMRYRDGGGMQGSPEVRAAISDPWFAENGLRVEWVPDSGNEGPGRLVPYLRTPMRDRETGAVREVETACFTEAELAAWFGLEQDDADFLFYGDDELTPARAIARLDPIIAAMAAALGSAPPS